MTEVALITAFDIVFGIFVAGVLVLLALVVPFILRNGARARRTWAAQRGAGVADEADGYIASALVLAGGGTRGAAQVGMLQVLSEHGFVPDRIYGASVGAVNGAAFACDPTRDGVERLSRVWRGIKGGDIYPQRLVHGPWQFLQQRPSVHPNTGLRRVVEAGLDVERIEQTVIPFEVVATSLDSGAEKWFTSGPAVDVILASSAIPAIFPPVEIDGERFIDGGVVNNVPISRAIEAGLKRIVVLLCGPPTYSPPPSRRPVEVMLNALFISIHARFVREIARIPPDVEVIICSAGGVASRDYTDFSDTEALIEEGRAQASEMVRAYGLGNRSMPVNQVLARSPRPIPSIGPPSPSKEEGDGTAAPSWPTQMDAPRTGQPDDVALKHDPVPGTGVTDGVDCSRGSSESGGDDSDTDGGLSAMVTDETEETAVRRSTRHGTRATAGLREVHRAVGRIRSMVEEADLLDALRLRRGAGTETYDTTAEISLGVDSVSSRADGDPLDGDGANDRAPDRLAPDRPHPDRLAPDRPHPDRLAPDRLHPDRLAPDGPPPRPTEAQEPV